MKILAIFAAIAPNRKAAAGMAVAVIAYEIIRAIVLTNAGITLPSTVDLLTLLGTLGIDSLVF